MDIRSFQSDPALAPILHERAALLAAQDVAQEDGSGAEELTFRLGAGRYRLPISAVREVVPLRRYTPLPTTPPFLIGLVNVRGRLLALLDLRPLLDLPPLPPAGFVLILGVGDSEVGLLADEIIAVARHSHELAATPAVAAGRNAPWVRGVDAQMSLAFDPTLLLADPRLIVDAGQTEP